MIVDRILSSEEQLIQFPFSGRIVPEYTLEEIRELIRGHYRIIYRILDQEMIEVLTVVHSARDLS
jgi:plasmid stabilization system protein ParE